jgi:hypothetical protein
MQEKEHWKCPNRIRLPQPYAKRNLFKLKEKIHCVTILKFIGRMRLSCGQLASDLVL